MCSMRLSVLLLSLTLGLPAATLSDKADTPFKLATFEAQGKIRVGLVFGERIVDLAAANTAVAQKNKLPAMNMPATMLELDAFDFLSNSLFDKYGVSTIAATRRFAHAGLHVGHGWSQRRVAGWRCIGGRCRS